MSLYVLLKYVHILLAIVALGFNLSYGLWLSLARRSPVNMAYALRGIRLLDNRFATPAYVLLLITGLLMVWVGDLSFTEGWILGALGLYVVVVLLAMFGFAPALARLTATIEGGGAASEAEAAGRRVTLFGAVTIAGVLAIEFLMVTKPG